MSDGGLPLWTEGSLQLCCTGRESLVRRRVRSITPMTDGGLTLRPKGAEALPHQKGEPHPTLNRQGYSRRGFDASEEGLPLQPKGASGSAAPGVRAPSATERAAQLEMTDGGVTLRPKGAVGLLHRKGSPVRC